jgi:integrase
MSGIFRRGAVWYAKIKGSSRRWTNRTCGTEDRALAKRMGAMLDELGWRGRQTWDVLDAVVENRVMLPELYAAYASNSLDALRERMSDTELSPMVTAWLNSLAGRVAADTVQHYRVHVRSLIPEDADFPRSALTFERLSEWLAKLPVSSGTKRKYHAAMSGFCGYLRLSGVLRHNPMRDVRAPAAGASRCRYLDHDDVLTLVNALDEPYRTICALMHGSGIELSVALGLKRRDVDVERGTVHARGTKTKARDRIAFVEPWALAYVKEHIRHMHPYAPLFPSLDRSTVGDKVRDARKALEIDDYQLRDARHTYAVRAIRAGAPFEVVARQLGHANTAMVVRVYGRFLPSTHEMQNWHHVAAALDAKEARR